MHLKFPFLWICVLSPSPLLWLKYIIRWLLLYTLHIKFSPAFLYSTNIVMINKEREISVTVCFTEIYVYLRFGIEWRNLVLSNRCRRCICNDVECRVLTDWWCWFVVWADRLVSSHTHTLYTPGFGFRYSDINYTAPPIPSNSTYYRGRHNSTSLSSCHSTSLRPWIF